MYKSFKKMDKKTENPTFFVSRALSFFERQSNIKKRGEEFKSNSIYFSE